MKISIIIPTLNEEKYLPKLLKSIKEQEFTDYEVIIADANSTDKTLEIAQEYGAKVIPGGMPAVGRNKGAKIAQGDFLFFLDSDVILPKHFLSHALTEMRLRGVNLASCEFLPLSNLLLDKIIHKFGSLSMKLSQFSVPHAPGFCFLITKDLFDRVGGFDETITIAEDHDLVKRASKISPFRVLTSTYIKVSVRRLDKEGRLKLLKKYMQVEMYRIFKGELRDNRVEYEFGKFDDIDETKKQPVLVKLDKQLDKLDDEFDKFIKNNIIPEKFSNGLDKPLSKFKETFKSSLQKFKDFLSKK